MSDYKGPGQWRSNPTCLPPPPPPSPPNPTTMLVEDNRRMREAGSELAIAAMRVSTEYDGVHRLMLAVSAWTKALADEGRRGSPE